MYDTRQDGDGDDTDVLPFAGRTGHPRYFAFIPGSGTWPDALGADEGARRDLLAVGVMRADEIVLVRPEESSAEH